MEAMRVFKERKVRKSTTPADIVDYIVSMDQAEAANEQTRNLIFSVGFKFSFIFYCENLSLPA